ESAKRRIVVGGPLGEMAVRQGGHSESADDRCRGGQIGMRRGYCAGFMQKRCWRTRFQASFSHVHSMGRARNPGSSKKCCRRKSTTAREVRSIMLEDDRTVRPLTQLGRDVLPRARTHKSFASLRYRAALCNRANVAMDHFYRRLLARSNVCRRSGVW